MLPHCRPGARRDDKIFSIVYFCNYAAASFFGGKRP
jgi:hypothetical protein